MKKNRAIAIFVKTPGLSPFKTRLAKKLKQDDVLNFYLKSLNSVDSIISKLKLKLEDLDIYWAIAEENGIKDKLWSKHFRIFQGNGNLGDRLNCVYQDLFSKYNIVYFVGADSPHLDFEKLWSDIKDFEDSRMYDFLLGPTLDGGYYLFGGKKYVPSEIWLDVLYSTNTTFFEFDQYLKKISQVKHAILSFDIDEVEDLIKYNEINLNPLNFTDEQYDLISWVKNLKM